jgi:hypothetical protein
VRQRSAAFTLLGQGADVALTCEIVDENRFDDRVVEQRHRWGNGFFSPRPPDKKAGGCNTVRYALTLSGPVGSEGEGGGGGGGTLRLL